MSESYPIPGEILNSGDFFGLSYDQILMIASAPIIVMMFSIVTGVIPMWVSLALGGVTAVAVLVVVAKTPDGQDPIEWAGAAFKRRVSPDQYTLQPPTGKRENPVVMDVVHTSDELGEFSDTVEKKLDEDSKKQPNTNASNPLSSDKK